MYRRKITLMLIVSTTIFLISTIIGYRMRFLSEPNFEPLKETFKFLQGLNPYILTLIIFLNNSAKTLIVIVLGVTVGIVPILFVSLNGLILGYAMYRTLPELGVVGLASLILPHGVFELPAALLSTALGLLVGLEVIKKLIRREASVKTILKYSLKIYVKYIIPMLITAAVVEVFITPYISKLIIPEG